METLWNEWNNTSEALTELESSLNCCVCKKLVDNPCTLGGCDHFFCRSCISSLLGESCPVCGIPSHVKDAQTDRQLANAVSLCRQLSRLLAKEAAASKGEISKESNENSSDIPCTPVDQIIPNRSAANEDVCTPQNPKSRHSYPSENSKREEDNIEGLEAEQHSVKKLQDNHCHVKDPPGIVSAEALSVFDFVGSPTTEPNVSIARKTRKGAKKAKKKQAVKISNQRWGFTKTNTISSEAHDVLDMDTSCTSCKKSNKGVRRVRVVSPNSQQDVHLEDTKKTLDLTSCSDDSDGDYEIVDTSKQRKTMKERTTPGRQELARSAGNTPAKRGAGKNKSKKGRKKSVKVGSKNAPASEDEDSDIENSEGGISQDEVQILSQNGHPHKEEIQIESCMPKFTRSTGQPWLSPVVPTRQTLLVKQSTHTPETPEERTVHSREKKSSLASHKTKTSHTRVGGIASPSSPHTPTGRRKLVNTIKGSPSSVSSSPSLTKKNPKGETPLHVAAIKGDLETVQTLLEEGATPNVKDNAGWSPLHEACNHGFVEIARLLLDNGAFINVPGMDNDTPLHDAINNRRIDCVKLLVARGASLTARNIHGYTPVDLARTPDLIEALDTPLAQSQYIRTKTEVSSALENHQVVLLSTGLSREQKIQVQKCAQMLHGKTVEIFGNEVTHVVTSVNAQGMCPRTLKYLTAVLMGKWILNFEWVEHCLGYKERVCEEAFEVPGSTTNPDSQTPFMARTNRQQQLPGLFDGCNFYLQGEFCYPTPVKEELQSLIQAGGGHILSREPKVDSLDDTALTVPYHAKANSQLANCSHYIINDNRNGKAKMRGSRMCIAPAKWLIDCIARFQVDHLP